MAVLLLGAAGYGYWTGLIGDRPGSIAREVTKSLQEAGFDSVTVAMGKDWVAHVSGSVVGQDKKQALEATLAGRSEIVGTNFDALEVRPSHDEILAEIAKALAASRLGHITAEVDDRGSVILTGRAEREHEIERASDTVMSVPGVSAVDPRISLPFAVLQREINQALRESGFTGVRIGVRNIDDISVSGILREEQDRAAVIAKIVETGAAYREAIDPEAIHDQMTIDVPIAPSEIAVQAPVVTTAPPARQSGGSAAPDTERPQETSRTASSSIPPATIHGTWEGSIKTKWLPTLEARIWVERTSGGGAVGRTEYAERAPYGKTTTCHGTLFIVEASSNLFVFREGIKRGCPGGGLIKMSLISADTVEAQWTPLKRPDKVDYSGTLRRR